MFVLRWVSDRSGSKPASILPSVVALTALLVMAPSPSWAQTLGGDEPPQPEEPPPEKPPVRLAGETEPYQEYSQRLRSAQEVSPLSSDVFGEQVNLHDGQTRFANVDIDVPGTGPAVQLRRRLAITRMDSFERIYGGFGNWDIEVPHITATVSGSTTWTSRCSTPFLPSPSPGFWLQDIWSGLTVNIPGGVSSELYYLPGSTSTEYPTGDGYTYRWTTNDYSVIRCEGASTDEAFVLTTPEGTKYTFNVFTQRDLSTLRATSPSPPGFVQQTRRRVFMLASRVEDRYGNRVEYSYNENGHPYLIRGYLSGETGVDREIVITYTGMGVTEQVQTATAHGRSWGYAYSGTLLQYVTPPYDADLPTPKPRWSYAYDGSRLIVPAVWDGTNVNCTNPPEDSGNYTVTIDHPGGARGVFVFEYHRLARSGVPLSSACETYWVSSIPNYKLLIPNFADNFALQSKTITGTGLSSLVWTYNYEFSGGGPQPLCGGSGGPSCASQTSERQVRVTEPDASRKTYRFGIKYRENFGRLLGTETRTPVPESVLATTSTVYFNGTPSPFKDRYGTRNGVDDDVHHLIRPVTSQSETRSGMTYTASTLPTQFDRFARPLVVTRASSPSGASRTETTVYRDKTSPTGGASNVWILGRIESVTVGGFSPAAEAYTFHAATLDRSTETRFGKQVRSFSWYANGALEWVRDGASQETKLSNYYHGVPGRITYADATFQQAGINAFGQITSVTNEVGYTTNYIYTADGRLNRIDYPTGDTVAWTSTDVSFVPTTDSTLGVSGSHWRQTVTTGTGRKIVELDALWRPIVTREEDTAAATTRRYVARRFDHAGRETFVSYPSSDWATSVTGTWNEYDGLGRPTKIEEDSELSPMLKTTIVYGAGQKTVTNPGGFSTTTKYQAFDVPSEDAPVQITDDIGTTNITRDALGKPMTLSRSGIYTYPGTTTDISVSRATEYKYDDYQRLCRISEPESRATVIAYDAANNVNWRATGQPYGTSCDNVSSLPQVAELTYDSRNRLKNSLFTDPATPNIHRTYTNDGLLSTVDSDGSSWSYGYNRRRLPTTEMLTLTGLAAGTWSITHNWNVHGHRQSLQYPDGSTVDYDPNGLGQPRNVRNIAAGINYATTATYHPTGAIAGFSYGNGIVHAMTPNARGLPERWNDGSIVRDAYVWDKNGNLTGLTDTRAAVLQTRTRSMAYDARDRLTSMTTAYNSRTFSYTYDPLDNLRTTSANAGGRNLRHAYGAFGQLTRLFDPANPSLDVIAYTYDDRGNAKSRTSATGFIPNTTLIVPDTANRVQSMTTGGSLETFTYDGHGRRTRSTTTSGTLVHFYTQAGQLLLSENPATPTTLIKSRQYHIYLGDRRVAQQEIDGRSYIHTDHIGSLLARTDTAGSLLEGAPIWEAWGAPVSGYSSVGGVRFAGHYTDRATGLSYMQQRYYDPYAGRFLAVDPVAASPSNLNRYWYANGNPYKYIDPDGRYGRGTGWRNEDWNRFNRAQKDAASKLEKAAAKINKALETGEGMEATTQSFERTFGEGSATAANMSAVAATLGDMASALRDDGSAGFTANLSSSSEMSAMLGRDVRGALAAGQVNGKAMYVNRDHPLFGNSRELGRATGHESAHNFGLRDRRHNGFPAYIDGIPKEQDAYRNLPSELRLINPDHLMDFR